MLIRMSEPGSPPPTAESPFGPGGMSRRSLVAETWFVQLAFLFPGVAEAVDVLAAHARGVSDLTRFPTVVSGHPVENLILGVFSYLAVGAMVPLALLLLARTGSPPAALGFTRPRLREDVIPGTGVAAAGYGTAVLVGIMLSAAVAGHRDLISQVPTGDVPKYYILYGLAVAAVTAVTEETLVSGYLLTRLGQLGWDPRWALTLSLALRTSYHVYYGLGFLVTIPFGFYATRSFQKHGRLARPIFAHFLYDAVLITISVLAA